MPSPAPIKRIGMPNCWTTAIATPPLAVPSNLVKTTPLSWAAWENTSACRRPFCPKVESRTNRDSTRALGAFLSMILRILLSSSMRFFLFCSLPAVSINSSSVSLDWAAAIASNTTAAGSVFLPGLAITSTPLLFPQTLTCSTAAARKVSAAPIRHL